MNNLDGIFAGGMPPLAQAARQLDLGALRSEAALLCLQDTIETCMKSSTASLFVHFNPAIPGAGDENLFAPVGRYLRNMKKLGVVQVCYPVVQAETSGFYVVFKKS